MAKSISPQFHIQNIVQLQVIAFTEIKTPPTCLRTKAHIYLLQSLSSAACIPLLNGQINQPTIPYPEHCAVASHRLHRDQNATNMPKDESTHISPTIPFLSRLHSPIEWPNQSAHNSISRTLCSCKSSPSPRSKRHQHA